MADHHLIAFLPFVELTESCNVAGVTFQPFRAADGSVTPELKTAEAALAKILSGYKASSGDPITNCVVALFPERGWDATRQDLGAVHTASSLLFLAAWARNDYFGHGNYVNATNFRWVGQAFDGDVPRHVSLSARRRDGTTRIGGYEHGEWSFSAPPQLHTARSAVVDLPFLAALEGARAAGSPTFDRLSTALPFVNLANTDDDLMTEHAEAILMGASFEHLLGSGANAYFVGEEFGKVFGRFGSVTVGDVLKVRSGIRIDDSKAERAAAQPTWWVHRKWAEELYSLRGKVVHGRLDARQWGWQLDEHLVMAAFVFPLLVKLLLEAEGLYTLTLEDEGACRAVDALLATTEWDTDGEAKGWAEVIGAARSQLKWDAAMKSARARAEAGEHLQKRSVGECPRCGGELVERHSRPEGTMFVRDEGARCSVCGLRM